MTPLYRVSEAVNDAEKYFPLHDYSALILRLWKTMRTYVSMLNARAQLLFDYYFNGFYSGFPQPPSQHSQFKQALSLLIFLSRRRSRFFFTSITSVAFCYHHNVTVFITSFSFVAKVWHGQKSSTRISAIQFLEQLVTGCNLRVMDKPRNLSSNKYFLMSRNELPYIFISVRSEKSHFYIPSCLNISQWVCTTNYSL